MKRVFTLIFISFFLAGLFGCQTPTYREFEEYELSTEIERWAFYHPKLEGAHWKYLFKMGADTTVFYDTENIKKKRDAVWVWTKFNYQRGYTVVLNEVNCEEETIRHTQSIAYNEKGMPKLRSYYTAKWKFVVPKTLSDEIKKVACQKPQIYKETSPF